MWKHIIARKLMSSANSEDHEANKTAWQRHCIARALPLCLVFKRSQAVCVIFHRTAAPRAPNSQEPVVRQVLQNPDADPVVACCLESFNQVITVHNVEP